MRESEGGWVLFAVCVAVGRKSFGRCMHGICSGWSKLGVSNRDVFHFKLQSGDTVLCGVRPSRSSVVEFFVCTQREAEHHTCESLSGDHTGSTGRIGPQELVGQLASGIAGGKDEDSEVWIPEADYAAIRNGADAFEIRSLARRSLTHTLKVVKAPVARQNASVRVKIKWYFWIQLDPVQHRWRAVVSRMTSADGESGKTQ